MRNFVLLFATVLFIFSCESVVHIDVPKDEQKLVVNSFFSPDSNFSLSLHQSKSILHTGRKFTSISGAKVTLYDDEGNELARLKEVGETGIYEADIKPEAGQTYQIKVSENGFKTVTATDMIPADSAKMIKYEASLGGPEGDDLILSIWIDDPPGKDFYELYAIEKSILIGESDTLVYENTMYSYSDDPVFEETGGISNFLFFDDELFDGDKEKITVTLSGRISCSSGCTEEEEVTLYIRKISEAYFRYKETMALQRDVGNGPFTEPVPVYNNIENGFGIFAGFRTSEYAIEVPEE